MAKEDAKVQHDLVGYIFGIISISAAFFQPMLGLVLGIVGLFQVKKVKSELAKKGKTLNIIGIILCLVFIAVSIAAIIYSSTGAIY